MRSTGALRLLSRASVYLPVSGADERYAGLPADVREIERIMYLSRSGYAGNISAIKRINENADIVIASERLDDVPMLLLSCDSGHQWDEVQQELLHWSGDVVQKTMVDCGHYVHWAAQEEVCKEIEEFVKHCISD